MIKSKIDPAKLIYDPAKLIYKLGGIIYSPSLQYTGIIVGYCYINNSNCDYTVKRLDNKKGHQGRAAAYRANGTKFHSINADLYYIPVNNKIELKKSLSSNIFKLLKI